MYRCFVCLVSQIYVSFRALFHNKTEVWEEIEAKINAENEVPILKTSNKVHFFQCNFQRPNIHFMFLYFVKYFPHFASRKSHPSSKNCEESRDNLRVSLLAIGFFKHVFLFHIFTHSGPSIGVFSLSYRSDQHYC